MPHQKAQLHLIGEADWFGVIGLALGLGSLTVVLEEGEREQWFSSPTIIWLSIASAMGFIFLFVGQIVSRHPVIRLSLLRDRQFGAVVLMASAIGMAMYGTVYTIPQFLSGIADYNSLQSGRIVLLSGVPIMVMMPIIPFLIQKVDIRIAVGFGMSMLALSAWLETDLTVFTTGGGFVDSQLLRGVGAVFSMMFLNQAAIQSVPRDQASDAAGLFNSARNLGGSLALAGIAVIQDQRMWLHSRRIEESLSANSVNVQDYIQSQARLFGSNDAAVRMLGGAIQRQALALTYIDLFFILAVGIALVTPLVLFLRPLPKGAPMAQAH
jgi:DHA2 family multidrug resistance protein